MDSNTGDAPSAAPKTKKSVALPKQENDEDASETDPNLSRKSLQKRSNAKREHQSMVSASEIEKRKSKGTRSKSMTLDNRNDLTDENSSKNGSRPNSKENDDKENGGKSKIDMDQEAEKLKTELEQNIRHWDTETRLKQFALDLMRPVFEKMIVMTNEFETMKEEYVERQSLRQEITNYIISNDETMNQLLAVRDEAADFVRQSREDNKQMAVKMNNLSAEMEQTMRSMHEKEASHTEMNRKLERQRLQIEQVTANVRLFWTHVEQQSEKAIDNIEERTKPIEVQWQDLNRQMQEVAVSQRDIETKMKETSGAIVELDKLLHSMDVHTAVENMVSAANKLFAETSLNFNNAENSLKGEIVDLNTKMDGAIDDVKNHFTTAMSAVDSQQLAFVNHMQEVQKRAQEQLELKCNQMDEYMSLSANTLDQIGDDAKLACKRVEDMVESLKADFQMVNLHRKQERTARDLELKSLTRTMDVVIHKSDSCIKNLSRVMAILKMIVAVEGIQSKLDLQDTFDRQTISLVAIKDDIKAFEKDSNKESGSMNPASARKSVKEPKAINVHGGPMGKAMVDIHSSSVTVNDGCLTCGPSYQNKAVMHAFKLACLHYNSTEIKYCGQLLSRPDLLFIRQELLLDIAKMVHACSHVDDEMLSEHGNLLKEFNLLGQRKQLTTSVTMPPINQDPLSDIMKDMKDSSQMSKTEKKDQFLSPKGAPRKSERNVNNRKVYRF